MEKAIVWNYFLIPIFQLMPSAAMILTGNWLGTVQSWFSDIKFSDNLWLIDYFSKTIFQFTT